MMGKATPRGFLTLNDVAQVSRAVLSKRAGADVPESAEQSALWRSKWGAGDWISITLLAVCMTLIVFAPVLLNQGFYDLLLVIAEEMHPWP